MARLLSTKRSRWIACGALVAVLLVVVGVFTFWWQQSVRFSIVNATGGVMREVQIIYGKGVEPVRLGHI